MSNTTSTIFFSYARIDAEFALKLAESLRNVGVSLWIDQLDIPAGVHWDSAIQEALEKAGRLLVILSPSAMTSNNVRDEVSFGLEEGKQVIPVLHQSCKIPFRLRRIQHVDFTCEYNQGLKQLLADLDIRQPADEAEPLPLTESALSDVSKSSPSSQKAKIEGEPSDIIEKSEETSFSIHFLEDRLRSLRPYDDLYIRPRIPEKKLKNAINKIGVPPDEVIVGLIDLTVLGSGSNALLFGLKWHLL